LATDHLPGGRRRLTHMSTKVVRPVLGTSGSVAHREGDVGDVCADVHPAVDTSSPSALRARGCEIGSAPVANS
jgi:hypothetical protein